MKTKRKQKQKGKAVDKTGKKDRTTKTKRKETREQKKIITGKSNDGKLTLTPWYALKEDGYNTYNCDIKQRRGFNASCWGRKMNAEQDAPECYNKKTKGEDYRGKEAKITDTRCLNWNLVTSNKRYNSLQNNYCRNPGGDKDKPWCVTKVSSGGDIEGWGYCNISPCKRKPITKEGFIDSSFILRKYP